MTIESFGELDISLYCEQSRDPETLVPKAYLDEFYALGYEGFLISGRKPEALGETAADAFGCTKPRILGAFAAENILLLIPVSVISAVLGCSFIRLVFNIISAYIGLKFNAVIDLSAVFIAAALMIAVEILILLISFLLFRKKTND